MEQTFLTGINIENVRHLSNILIPLDKDILLTAFPRNLNVS